MDLVSAGRRKRSVESPHAVPQHGKHTFPLPCGIEHGECSVGVGLAAAGLQMSVLFVCRAAPARHWSTVGSDGFCGWVLRRHIGGACCGLALGISGKSWWRAVDCRSGPRGDSWRKEPPFITGKCYELVFLRVFGCVCTGIGHRRGRYPGFVGRWGWAQPTGEFGLSRVAAPASSLRCSFAIVLFCISFGGDSTSFVCTGRPRCTAPAQRGDRHGGTFRPQGGPRRRGDSCTGCAQWRRAAHSGCHTRGGDLRQRPSQGTGVSSCS
mmetsp:Transcript_19371/g.46645  ORF Transcript_19371/g.46645 Transcript_19371/m.46645 type:complete len:266 (+) Transcript_19371:239-1036(+)